ncbi:MAG: hypothetical protein JWQ27_479 [Ferruginibacter sp.]|nr:hypothetical protein [Ferruginibacter sp.]
MNKTFLLILFLAGTLTTIAQEKITGERLAGKWNVITMDIPGRMYYSSVNDSLFMSRSQIAEINENSGDTSLNEMMQSMMKGAMKAQLSKMIFFFDDKGNVYDIAQGEANKKNMGRLDMEKNLFYIKDEETNTEKEIPVDFKNGLLRLAILDEGIIVSIWCKKMI